ncbi:hypothetical protein OESDEN_18921, partial [Oesophagostomum dentatum]
VEYSKAKRLGCSHVVCGKLITLSCLYNETGFGCSDDDGMSDEIRRTFLEMHNGFRSSLARGLEYDQLIGGNAAQAAKMLKMASLFSISQLIYH